MDDDPTVHEILKERINGKLTTGALSIHTFLDFHAADKALSKIALDDPNLIFLADYDCGDTKTGIELIERHSLQRNSLVVTRSSEDSEVLDKCKRLGVRVVPKILVEKTTPIAAS